MDPQDLRALENRCIQEWAPWCTASCPVHVDVRAMTLAIGVGGFDAAAKAFRRAVPFPGIISRICDRPCEAVCKRVEAGGAISIRFLERAALGHSTGGPEKITVLPKKEKRVAVVGGGLSGLTAAVDLAKKGYGVVLFEATGRMGGGVWEHSEEKLPRHIILEDLRILESLPVEIRLDTALGKDVVLSALQGEFQAVYLGMGRGSAARVGLTALTGGEIRVDPVTFAAGPPGVFAGGGICSRAGEPAPIRSVSEGRRAAISMDRYLQGVSLTASRENEGSYETRLYMSLQGVESAPRVPAADPGKGYGAEYASLEAKRCLQCECMECVKVCEFLAHFKAYPKRYVRQVYNNLSIVMGQRHGNKFINSCSICGLCREVCPEDLHMGEVCKGAREIMVTQGKMPPSAHEFALRDMAFSNSEEFALTRHQPGTASSAYLFFPGCQLSASSPQQVKAVYGYLRERLSGGVGLMLGCCGAPADWSGRSDLFAETMEGFRSQWQEMGGPRLIVACSTCHQIFKSHLSDAGLDSLWEMMDELGLPEGSRRRCPGVLAVHDPCTSRHEGRVQESVRNILRALGIAFKELPLSRQRTECCGYGGLMSFANPDLAERVVNRRIAEAPENYLAYCAICRDHFAARGKPTWHLLDLIFGGEGEEKASRRGPGFSQRHENRARLKTSLLRELWSDTVGEPQGHETIRLHISSEVLDLMEKRQILVEDLQRVIEHAERTGRRLLNRASGHFLAHYRPLRVTYWVEYSSCEGGFAIHNAYSHRMEIVEEGKA